jgi:CBS domain-containing protein
MTAADIMTRTVHTITAAAPLRECMALMVREGISGLPVCEGDRVVGIITTGDVIKRIRRQVPWAGFFMDGTTMPMGADSGESLHTLLAELRERPVRECMTPHVISVTPDEDIQDVAKVMLDRRIKRVPVLEARRLVGVITRGDLVRGMLAV